MSVFYLIYNLVIFIPCFLLSKKTGIGTHSQVRSLVRSFILVSFPFIAWDIWATSQGHWAFSDRFTLGFELFGLPFEEVLFFFTVPFSCMFVWDCLGMISSSHVSQLKARIALVFIAVVAMLGAIVFREQDYTLIALLVCSFTAILLLFAGKNLISLERFWYFQLIGFGLFIIFNLILSGLPVVTYGSEFNTGIRFITIPVEDFFYNFGLLNLFLLSYSQRAGFMQKVQAFANK